MEFFNYMLENKDQIISLCIEHIELTAIALIIAIIIGVPIGILISYKKKLNKPILGVTSVTQAIPSMALLGFMIPFPAGCVQWLLFSIFRLFLSMSTCF